MGDWRKEWQDELDQRAQALVMRAQVHLDDLQVRYLALRGMTGQTSMSVGDGGRGVHGPRVPIRVDVVDLLRDVEVYAVRYAGLVAGTLRAGSSNTRSIVGALSYVADNLGPATIVDPTLTGDVESGAAKLRWRARRIVGEVSTAFPVDVTCPECGLMSLWVHPGRGIVKCGVESCAAEWSVGDVAVPVWTARRSGPN